MFRVSERLLLQLLTHQKRATILPILGLFSSLVIPPTASLAAESTNRAPNQDPPALREKAARLTPQSDSSPTISSISGSLIISGAIFASAAAIIYALRRQHTKRQEGTESGVAVISPQLLIDDIGGNQFARDALKLTAGQWEEAVRGEGLGGYPRRILIVAPEGSGKSLAAEGLVAAAGFSSFVRLNAADLLAPRGGRKPVEVLFEAVRAARKLQESMWHERRSVNKALAVLVIEGVDHVGFKGVSDTRNPEYQPLRQILAQLQSLFRDGNRDADGILLVCTANNLEDLDSEFTSIFEQSVPIYSSRTLKQRSDLISALVNRLQREWRSLPYKITFPDQESLCQLAVLIDGLSGEQVKRVLLDAADLAFARSANSGDVKVTLPDLVNAFADIKLGVRSGEMYSPEQLHAMKLHELAHICVLKALDIPIPYLSMVPRGDAAARVQIDMSSKLAWPSSKADLLSVAFALIAGRAAENAYLGKLETTRGAQKDLDDIIKVAKVLAEHGFIGEMVYPGASQLPHSEYPDLRKLLGSFIEKATGAVSTALLEVFPKEEFLKIAEKMPDIAEDSSHLYGHDLEAFLQDLLPQEKVGDLKDKLLAEMEKMKC